MQTAIQRKAETLRRALFICDDNHHTSRFCEELFNSLARGEGLNWQASSRGVLPRPAARHDAPMSPAAIGELRALGAAPVNHMRLPLEVTAFDFQMSHIVIGMGLDPHRTAIEKSWPEYAAQIEHWPLDGRRRSRAGLVRLNRDVRQLVATLMAEGFESSRAFVPRSRPAEFRT